jgi:hypothetical protein
MTNGQSLAIIRSVHTAIYAVMAASTLVLLYAGISGREGIWSWTALALLAVESAIFAGNGFRCPLTALAVAHGAKSGHVLDTFLPERLTRYTFRLFGTIMAAGLLFLVVRWLGILR